MTNTPHVINVDLQETAARNLTARDVLAELTATIPHLSSAWHIFDASLADTPALSAEIIRLATQLIDHRHTCADLLAAARATLAAEHDGEPDPLYYLRDELAVRGHLPPAWGRR